MMSSRGAPKAKLVPRSPSLPSALTAIEESAIAFAEDVRRQAVAIVDAATAEVVFEGKRDPKGSAVKPLLGACERLHARCRVALHPMTALLHGPVKHDAQIGDAMVCGGRGLLP